MLNIIYEDKDILAVNKPAGILTHRTQFSEEETIADEVVKKYPEIASVGDKPEERPGVVHRLDRGTSGVILLAKNQEAFNYLKVQFQKHLVRKTYIALAWGIPKEARGLIDAPIGLTARGVKRSIHGERMRKDARTEYEVLQSWEVDGSKVSLIEARPLTGRTHQIRVHLKSIDCPILGDSLYDARFKSRPCKPERVLLHALRIELKGGSGNLLRLEADIPDSFGAGEIESHAIRNILGILA